MSNREALSADEKPIQQWTPAELALGLKALAFSLIATDALGRAICEEAATRLVSSSGTSGEAR